MVARALTRRSAALILTLTACTTWTPLQSPYPASLPLRQQAQVWTGTDYIQLHALRTDSAAITGVPFTLPPNCDTCRVAIPVERVDSIRLGAPEKSGVVLAALPFAALFGVVIALRAGIRGD